MNALAAIKEVERLPARHIQREQKIFHSDSSNNLYALGFNCDLGVLWDKKITEWPELSELTIVKNKYTLLCFTCTLNSIFWPSFHKIVHMLLIKKIEKGWMLNCMWYVQFAIFCMQLDIWLGQLGNHYVSLLAYIYKRTAERPSWSVD